MARVQLIHWNAAEAEERARILRSHGYEAAGGAFSPTMLAELRVRQPDAIVIDLGRLPSQGRDLAVNLRISAVTRYVPLVFVGGEPQKVARIRTLLPDARYTTWAVIEEALAAAIADPPSDPVVPESVMASYRGTPLVKKLGIKPRSIVVLTGAPEGFEELLIGLPEGAEVRREGGSGRGLTLWFVRSRAELDEGVATMVPRAVAGGLWIIWPKKSSGVVSDLSQTVVRETGLGAGLVDFKICSVDATWSGLRFTRREA